MVSELIQRLNENPLMHNGERCITCEQGDKLHERKKGHFNRTFNRNRSKFTEGKHYYSMTLKEFRQLSAFDAGNSAEGNPNIEVILFTEKGYCLAVKPMNDKRAWAIQEELVDGYFRLREFVEDASQVVFTRELLERIVREAVPQIIDQVETRLEGLVARVAPRPEPFYATRYRAEQLGYKPTAYQLKRIVERMLPRIEFAGLPRPTRIGTNGELVVPESQLRFADEAITAIMENDRLMAAEKMTARGTLFMDQRDEMIRLEEELRRKKTGGR